MKPMSFKESILTGHEANEFNRRLEVCRMDNKAQGGAHHRYRISGKSREDAISMGSPQMITFQKGPVPEAGVNGITEEALLAIVIDRLQCWQAGDFPCRENAIALTRLETGLLWLNKRTRDRMARGVEGTHQV